MPALDRPVITGEPEMVGLVIVGLTNVAAEAVNDPLNVLLVKVCALVVPTITPSPVAIPCTCVWFAASRIIWSMSKPRAAM